MGDPASGSLRILRVIPFHAPATRFGGPVVQADAVSRSLAARGHRVRVVTSDLGVPADVPRDTWLERHGYRVRYARTGWSHRLPPYRTPPGVSQVLTAELRDADVMTLNVGLTLLGGVAGRRARAVGVPYVYNAEGALCPERLGIKGLRKRLFLAAVERPLLNRAAALQAVTGKERSDYLRLGAAPERVHVIPNGIPVPGDGVPSPGDGGADFRRRVGVPAKAPLVLFLGRLHPVKGLDLLIEALADSALGSVHLICAGFDEGVQGGLQGRAGTLGLGARVHFLGHLDPASCRSALLAADLFALTSRSEGLPNAILEAAAAGLPLLVSDRCNVPEVAEWDAGRVVPPDVPGIRGALLELLASREARVRFGRNARRMAAGCFAQERVVDRLEALYRSLCR